MKKKKVKALVVRTAGINCDIETKHALEMVGAQADLVHTNELTEGKVKLLNYDIVAFPGGFSYGTISRAVKYGPYICRKFLTMFQNSLIPADLQSASATVFRFLQN
ncbi:phosphoribosylformylglycinamidine (FGAM) synthase-like amidotransferase family enzyme [Elusimicrobium posterum]